MTGARPVLLALLALGAVSGCRTAGVDNLARRDAPPPKATLDARKVIDEHNRNAERIESVEGQPSLRVSAGGRAYGVDGRLALERPRNFRLDISHMSTGEVADIGSNDEKFWFWVRDSKDKAVYYCKYDEWGETPLVAALQPDWIVEALGLRVITPEEVGEFTVTRGDDPDDVVLTHRPSKTGGETVTRVTIISERTRRIKEHRLMSGDRKTTLARATVQSYFTIVPDDAKPGSDDLVYLPQKLKLEWFREKLSMEATFHAQSTKVNAEIDARRRKSLFVEQARKGYARVNLAKEAGMAEAPMTIRETRPAPPAGVELGEPAPLGMDGRKQDDREPLALSSARRGRRILADTLVGPAMPRAPGLEFSAPGRTGWRSTSTPGFEQ